MIFIVNNDPFGAVQLQNQLKSASSNAVEVYLSAEETEQNLYKLPEIIFIEENLGIGNLLYLTQSIKAYDSSIQIVWLCNENLPELKKMCKSYGVLQCLPKGEYFLERLSLTVIEAKELSSRNKFRQKRIEHLRYNILSSSAEIPVNSKK